MKKKTIRGRNEYTLTPQQLGKETGIGLTNVYKLLADGVIPHIRVGNRFIIPRSAMMRWLESCGQPSQPQLVPDRRQVI